MTERAKDNGTNEADAGGLPLEPERRAAAVTAQFDDFTAQRAALDEPAPPPDDEDDMVDSEPRVTTADAYRAALDRVEADLLAVVRRHALLLGPHLVACALIEVCGSVCGDIVQALPDAGPDLDQRLAQLRLFVSTTTGRPQ
jgi:hypothetical protein